jgi:hypothetical protein
VRLIAGPHGWRAAGQSRFCDIEPILSAGSRGWGATISLECPLIRVIRVICG